jgi:hypothetical protein
MSWIRVSRILFFSVCSLTGFLGGQSLPNEALTVVAIGDAGDGNRYLRAGAQTWADMLSGRHDGGRFDVALFLGDNFYNTGLNIPTEDVEGKIRSVLGPFSEVFERLGPGNVHAVPGEHDYYRRNAIEASFLFGLFSIEEAPVGITERGNEREASISMWRYYYRMPAHALYSIPGSADSVEFLFVDSSLPMRTPKASWIGPLDSLRRLLRVSARQSGIRWRILCLHHPWYSMGDHGGYSVWNDETSRVDFLTNCDRDSNAVSWLRNWLDPEDLCTETYRAYIDSLRSVLHFSGARVHLLLSGHDHSLQLLSLGRHDPRCTVCPNLQIISGSASRPTRVRFPAPPDVYTAVEPDPANKGVSQPGFAQLRFTQEAVRVVFFNAMTGNPVDMGGGKGEFWINQEGLLFDPLPRTPR